MDDESDATGSEGTGPTRGKRDSFRSAGQHLLSSGGGPIYSDLLSSELRHSVGFVGEHVSRRRSPGRRPDHANAARYVNAANKVSRAEARRYRGLPQARQSAWY